MKVLVTGGFGFIGSSLVKFLNDKGVTDIDICEIYGDFESKWQNVVDLTFNKVIPSEDLLDVLGFSNGLAYSNYDAVVLLGANSSTNQEPTLDNWHNNVNFPISILDKINTFAKKPTIIFASSAAVYGNETNNFAERLSVKPTNFYGYTKLNVDRYISKIQHSLDSHFLKPNIYSLRFFNVYGARELHKKGMASPIFKWLTGDGNIKLLNSKNERFKNADMQRDFIHVSDVCSVIYHCLNLKDHNSGIYNVGSGSATSWEIIANEIQKYFKAGSITYTDMSEDMNKYYQYYTCANLNKLHNVLGYRNSFLSIQEGIKITQKEIKELYGNV